MNLAALALKFTGAKSLLAQCAVAASIHYGLPPRILWAIRLAEGGQAQMAHHNSNGSYDYGAFQINSIWLPKLRGYGIDRQKLTTSACANAYAAGWILSLAWHKTGHGNLWYAVARYHSGTPSLGNAYAWRVYRIWIRLGGRVAGANNTPRLYAQNVR
ncbi:MAG TPA: lytic transglycosylase domain-containing protein [Gammaproteobacteria bacterium]|nr:lytic transglycosylase domain-containing protein [Gammaproteobacteria bacterium]